MEGKMAEQEMKQVLIDLYVNLQRIQSSENKDKEIAYQIKVCEAKLHSCGIPTEDLKL